MIECNFSNPLNYLNSVPLEGEPFSFSVMTCSNSNLINYVNTGTASFNFENVVDIGDILILTFLILFAIFGIFKFIWNFSFKDWNSKL